MGIRREQVAKLANASRDLVIAQDGERRLAAAAQGKADELLSLIRESTPAEIEAARTAGDRR